MSVVTDILDRLSGVTAVREKLNHTSERVEKVADMLLDHERRILALEYGAPPRSKAPSRPKRIK